MKENKMQDKSRRKKVNRITLICELLLTVGICIAMVFVGIFYMKSRARTTSVEVDSDYDTLIDSYITTFEMLTMMIENKIEEDYSFEEMSAWLQGKDSEFCDRIGDVYDGVALTYKGGYARSWSYGDYDDYDPTTRPWYQKAQEKDGDVAVVAPYVTYLDAKLLPDADDYILLSIARKYNDEITFEYDIKITEIKQILMRRRYAYKNTRALLYDKDGYILSSSNEKEFAHNIYDTDDVISEELNDALSESAKREDTLYMRRVDGNFRLLYSHTDEKNNTLCIMFPLYEVFQYNFLIIIVVTIFLVFLEAYFYWNNMKSIREFENRDARLSAISDAAYDEQIYIDLDTMTFSGCTRLFQLIAADRYDTGYYAIYHRIADEESQKRFERFLAPEVIKNERSTASGMTEDAFPIRMKRQTEGYEVRTMEIYKLYAVIDNRKILTLLCNDVTENAKILKKALIDAEAASRAKTEFLSRMSHDIRTPMNAIIGMTHLAKQEKNLKQVQEYLGNIERSSSFLLGLINDILDLSKIESGELELSPEPYTLEEFTSSVNTVIRPLMEAKQIEFVFDMKCGAECILVDRLRFNQIFFNLLSNAVKFTPAGGRVEFSAEYIPAREGIDGARYRVRDNGIGMSEEFLPHIYESFSQDDAGRRMNSSGTGLGLPIVKSLVDAMGGTIQVHSRVGEGTEFILDLYAPLAESEVTEPFECQRPVTLQDRQVLLAEDNDMNILVARRLLENEGCKVTIAKNGRQAVELYQSSEEGFFDVILMDVRMPVLDGLAAAREIRRLHRADHAVPIIAMTADAFKDDQKRTLDAGMDYHMSKPIEPVKLYTVLREYICQYREEIR